MQLYSKHVTGDDGIEREAYSTAPIGEDNDFIICVYPSEHGGKIIEEFWGHMRIEVGPRLTNDQAAQLGYQAWLLVREELA